MTLESSTSVLGAVRSTVRAYLLPLAYARSYVGRLLRRIRPSAGVSGVNVLFVALLLTTSFGIGTVTYVRSVEVYEAARGEIPHLELKDGSTVQLAPFTELRAEFSKERREITLVSGEAYFEVAHDAKRPFIVRTGHHVVRALGTRFDVRVVPDGINVTVSEGEVAVYHQPAVRIAAMPNNALRLGAGHMAHLRGGMVGMTALSPAEIDNKLAWRQRRLVFAGETLSEVIQDVNRFSPRRFVIDDRSIENLTIGGSLGVDEVDDLLEMLLRQNGVRHHLVDRNGRQEIHLRAASDAEDPHGNSDPR